MDISRLKARCNQLKNDKKVELQLAKDRSLRYEKLQNNYDMVCKLHGDVSNLKIIFNTFLKILAAEDNAFKQRRLKYLEAYIDRNLEVIFPNEGFRSKIHFDYSYNNQKVTLYLVDRYGKVRIPSVCEGSLLQQLIGFSAAVGIIECLGANKLYMDEAFSASSMENLTKISSLLKKLIEEDFQILIIEQKNDIFKDLPRREINIAKDAIKESVKILSVTDY